MKEEITVAKIVELKNVTKVYKTGERENSRSFILPYFTMTGIDNAS